MIEIVRALLTKFRSVVLSGIIGNAFWYSVGNLLLGIILDTGILEKIELRAIKTKEKFRR